MRALEGPRPDAERSRSQNPHLVASAKYHLIVGIEATIDPANHLIAKNRWRAPEDYADTFRIMGEQSVVDAEFTERLQKLADRELAPIPRREHPPGYKDEDRDREVGDDRDEEIEEGGYSFIET